ncbi:MAG: hypothetical protein O3B95_00270 [Chloroflexi bacterium]|nr:hypothetical protein [Chloroflexota bacterium]
MSIPNLLDFCDAALRLEIDNRYFDSVAITCRCEMITENRSRFQMLSSKLKSSLLIPLFAMIAAVAAGCGSSPASSSPAQQFSESTAQATAKTPAEPTSAPSSTPLPVTSLMPTVAPAIKYTSNGLTPIELPPALESGSERLDEDQVEALWTKTISNARHFVDDGAIVVDTCADGTGTYLAEFSRSGQTFMWNVHQDPGGRWNSAVARLAFSDPSIGSGGGGTVIPLEINADGSRAWPTYAKTFTAETFISPDC